MTKYAQRKRGRIFAAVSLPRVSVRVLKLKTVASLGKDYVIPANAKLPRVLYARLTPLLISHFTRITQHYEIHPLLMSFRPQIDFPSSPHASHSPFIFFIVLILPMILYWNERNIVVVSEQIDYAKIDTRNYLSIIFTRNLLPVEFIICRSLRALSIFKRETPIQYLLSSKLKVPTYFYSFLNYDRILDSTFLLLLSYFQLNFI